MWFRTSSVVHSSAAPVNGEEMSTPATIYHTLRSSASVLIKNIIQPWFSSVNTVPALDISPAAGQSPDYTALPVAAPRIASSGLKTVFTVGLRLWSIGFSFPRLYLAPLDASKTRLTRAVPRPVSFPSVLVPITKHLSAPPALCGVVVYKKPEASIHYSSNGTSSNAVSSTAVASDEETYIVKVSSRCLVAPQDAPIEESDPSLDETICYISREEDADACEPLVVVIDDADEDYNNDDSDDYDSRFEDPYDYPALEALKNLSPLLSNGETTYTLRGLLGRGGCGRVMLANTEDGRQVAIKVTHKMKQYRSKRGRDFLLHEKMVMEKATLNGSLYLTRLLASWEDDYNVYFVMDVYRDNLRTRMRRKPMTLEEAKICCAEMVYALKELHDSHTIHRDLKPENFLIDDDGRVVLCDFGFSYSTKPKRKFIRCKTFDVVGTPSYYAPEMIDGSVHLHGYNCAVDIYSLGLIFMEMISGFGKPYYDAHNNQEQYELMVNSSDRLDTWIKDAQARDLLRQMLETDPRLRPLPDAILAHPFFDEVDHEKIRMRESFHPCRPVFYAPPKDDISLTFSSFYFGLDDSYTSDEKSSRGFIKPNQHVMDQLSVSAEDDFKFPRP